MTSLILILLLLTVALWFAVNEAPMLFGLYEPTYALRRWTFALLISSAVLLPMLLQHDGSVSAGMIERFAGHEADGMYLLAVLVSSLLALSVLRMFSLRGTIIYAVLGALAASGLKLEENFQGGALSYMLSFVAAPLLAAAAAFLVSLILRILFRRCRIHLIRLSHYMRFAVIFSVVVTSVAVGLNLDGFMEGLSDLVPSSHMRGVAVSVTALFLMMTFMFRRGESGEEYYGDFTVYNVISVGLASSAVLLFFSFDSSVLLIGLSPVPLSVSSLVVASIAGASLAGKTHLVGREIYTKEIVSMVLSPAAAFLITYLLLHFSGNGEDVMDFIVMTMAIVALLAVYFLGYVRSQRRKQEITERLVATQQQQIYEHSRALNDMELKVVLSENQALHNAVEQKHQEVMNVALSIVEQREYLESLNDIVGRLNKSKDDDEKAALIAELGSSLRQRLSYDRDVDSQYFYAQAESLHEDFNAKLSENFPNLTQQERRLATLLRLGFSSKYIATLMNITPKSVEISRYRLRQKLGIDKGTNLVNFIKSI